LKQHIPADKIEEIKQHTDIVQLISEYVTLKKAGRNFLGLCPFHKEKTPSFTVNRDKQMFYCFGCGEGGHALTFLMKVSNMTFPEAARHLARKTGITIPDPMMNDQEREQYGVREQIYRINEAAAKFLASRLFSETGLQAREYLKKRGIREEVVREFRLGYADEGWRTLKSYFEQKNVALTMVAQAGLIVAKEEAAGGAEQAYYDRFRGRLIFPIEDAGGRVMAFGGRIIGSGEPKYLNSPETPVFSKGRNLYGLMRAKEGIRKSGYAILVEGYFDLISLWNAGLTNVVASLGTALTAEQVELLRRYTGNVAVLFDADEAGKKALQRSLQLFLSGGVQAKAVVLPEKYDPDDYVRQFGREKLEKIIDQAPSVIDYYIDHLVGEKVSLEEKRDAVREALHFVASFGDAIERNLFLKRISEKLGIDQEVLKKEAIRTREPSAELPGRVKEKTLNALDKVEFSLILFMLQHTASIAQVGESAVLNCFTDRELKSLGEEMIIKSRDNGSENLSASFFLDYLEDGPLKKLIFKSLLEGRTDDENVWERYVADNIKKIKRKWYGGRKKNLSLELIKAQEKGDSDWQNRLLREKEKLLLEEKLL
jgi:DNA primase